MSLCSWGLSASSNHNRSETNTSMREWNYTINLNPGGVSQVAATAMQSSLTTSYSATLNVTLDSQFVLSIPIQGDFEGESTSAAVGFPELQAETQILALSQARFSAITPRVATKRTFHQPGYCKLRACGDMPESLQPGSVLLTLSFLSLAAMNPVCLPCRAYRQPK